MEFDAKNENGERYRILILQHYREIGDDDVTLILPIQKEMRTSEGHSVNRINDRGYYIIGLNVEVERI